MKHRVQASPISIQGYQLSSLQAVSRFGSVLTTSQLPRSQPICDVKLHLKLFMTLQRYV